MKIRVYANVIIDEIEISKKEYDSLKTNSKKIPNRIIDQIEDALSCSATLNYIEKIDLDEVSSN